MNNKERTNIKQFLLTTIQVLLLKIVRGCNAKPIPSFSEKSTFTYHEQEDPDGHN